MPKYKLTYFNGRGRGEIIRLVLTVAGQDFEDFRIKPEEWPEIKKGTPFGQVPLLEVDGKLMNESVAIARYLAKKYNMGGKNADEQYLIDRVLGAVEDLYMKARQFLLVEKDETKKVDLEKEIETVHLPRFLSMFKTYLSESGGEYFVENSLTLADLAVHDILTTFIQRNDKLLDGYPTLIANRSATEASPNLAAYLAKRPKSDL